MVVSRRKQEIWPLDKSGFTRIIESNEVNDVVLGERSNLVAFPTVHIPERVNAIVNRLNKTKVVRDVDHEQERVDRIKVESAKRKAAALEQKKADAERTRQREADKAARSYDTLFTNADNEEEEEENGEAKEKKTGTQLEEDFM